MSNSGIYCIQNKITKQLYIGQSKNLKKRKKKHFSMLRNNNHFNKYLQRSFNKYGEDNFEFIIIEKCDKSKLDELEIAYMNLYNAQKNGFNIRDGGNVIPNNNGENNGMYGQTPSNARIDIDNCIDEIIKEYKFGIPLSYIAKEWNISRKNLRIKLRKYLSKEEMILINKKNLNSNLIKKDNHKGFTHGINARMNMSESKNTSGFFRVSYDNYGNRWIYKYTDENKKRIKITAKNIEDLKNKVKSKNLIWLEFKKD